MYSKNPTIFLWSFIAFWFLPFLRQRILIRASISEIPRLIPIRYEVQLQMPTSSDKDPLIPTFFGSLKVEFQLTRSLLSVQPPSFRHNADIGNSSSELDGVELTFLSIGLDSFDNITLKSLTGERYPVVDVILRENEVAFLVAESVLPSSRYILEIDRFQGVITYDKGIYYRDAGNLPVLSTNIFPDRAPSLFPSLGGPLTKTTTKILCFLKQ